MGLTKPRAHQLQDIDYKQTTRAVTTSNVTLSGGAPATVDGVSLALRDRVLVTGQSTGSENGIYYVTTVGAGSNGTWARSLDADTTGEVSAGMIIMVTEGTTYADTQWKLTTDDPITIGSTSLTFVRNGNAAYGTVAVSGEDSIVADAIGDTLTIVAGTNLALTTNASTDTLTITPSLTPSLTSVTATGNITGGNLLTGNVTVDDSGITATGNIQADMLINREQRFTTSNMMKFNQLYTGAASGSYFTNGEYQKVVTITPSGDSQNYQVVGRMTAQNAGETHTVYFNAALRSNTLPDLDWSILYTEEYNGSRYLDPQLWTKETTTAGFIFAFKTLATIYGTVTVDIDVIPRNSTLLDNVSVNTVQDSEQASVDAGFTANDMTLVQRLQNTNMTVPGNITAAGLSYPTSDGTADQVLVTDGAGTLSFADASGGGATVSSDTSTNTNFLLYFASTTTGALTAVKQDSGLTYNPSTGLLTSAAFSGSGASLTALNGSNISTGTVAAARVATLNQNTTGTAGGFSSAVTVSLSGDVTGSATFTSAGDTASITTTIAANSVALGTDTTGNYVGTITGGTGIASSGATTGEGVAHTLSVDLSELTDMTGGMVGTDEFIVLDAGADRRKAANEIGLSIFNNDSGFTTNTGTVTSVSGGTGLSGTVTSSGSLSIDSTVATLTGSQTLTNKTLTSPNINEAVALTATATELNYNDITTLGTVQASKTVTADSNGDVQFSDNDKLHFGTGTDLSIHHEPGFSIIRENNANPIFIQTDNTLYGVSITKKFGTEAMAKFIPDGAVTLYHNNSAKLATTSTGIDVTGELQADSLDIDGAADISGTLTMGGNVDLQDDDELLIGTNDDLRLYHTASNSYIDSNGAGILFIRQKNNDQDVRIQSDDGSGGLATYFQADGSNGQAQLFYYGSQKLNTKTDGINVTGELQADSLDIDGAADISGQVNFHSNVVMDDNNSLIIGNGSDLQIYHDGSNSYVNDTGTGSLIIEGANILIQDTQDDLLAKFNNAGAVELYHVTGGVSGVKLATSATGVTITGVMSGTATSARYADLAEKYTSDQDYKPGTVVELGGEYEVTQTRRSRSTAIAGIVSTNPAHLMNDQLVSEHVVDVALIGRVPCKVVGQVRKGDLLISSDEPGHAQAYKDIHNPPTGSVIGKAIESKDTEEPGVIEVLVGRL